METERDKADAKALDELREKLTSMGYTKDEQLAIGMLARMTCEVVLDRLGTLSGVRSALGLPEWKHHKMLAGVFFTCLKLTEDAEKLTKQELGEP